MRLRGFDAVPQQQGLYAPVAMPRCRPHQSPELHGLLVYAFVFRFLASAHELHIRELRLQTATEPFAASDPSGNPSAAGVAHWRTPPLHDVARIVFRLSHKLQVLMVKCARSRTLLLRHTGSCTAACMAAAYHSWYVGNISFIFQCIGIVVSIFH